MRYRNHGSLEDMEKAFEGRIDELKGKVNSSRKIKASEYGDLESAVYEKFSAMGFDVDTREVRNAIDACIEYIEMTHDAGDTEYTVEDWWKDTTENYPEEFEDLPRIDDIESSVSVKSSYLDEDDTTEWIEVQSKAVQDSNGFWTDYTWYRNQDGTKHIFMFGDKDIYTPDANYADWECESYEEAEEWFDSYDGFDAEDDDLLYL